MYIGSHCARYRFDTNRVLVEAGKFKYHKVKVKNKGAKLEIFQDIGKSENVYLTMVFM